MDPAYGRAGLNTFGYKTVVYWTTQLVSGLTTDMQGDNIAAFYKQLPGNKVATT